MSKKERGMIVRKARNTDLAQKRLGGITTLFPLSKKNSQPYGLFTLHLGRSKRALIDEKCGDPAMKPKLRRPVTGDERVDRRLRS